MLLHQGETQGTCWSLSAFSHGTSPLHATRRLVLAAGPDIRRRFAHMVVRPAH